MDRSRQFFFVHRKSLLWRTYYKFGRHKYKFKSICTGDIATLESNFTKFDIFSSRLTSVVYSKIQPIRADITQHTYIHQISCLLGKIPISEFFRPYVVYLNICVRLKYKIVFNWNPTKKYVGAVSKYWSIFIYSNRVCPWTKQTTCSKFYLDNRYDTYFGYKTTWI